MNNVVGKFPLLSFPSISKKQTADLVAAKDSVQDLLDKVSKSLNKIGSDD